MKCESNFVLSSFEMIYKSFIFVFNATNFVPTIENSETKIAMYTKVKLTARF